MNEMCEICLARENAVKIECGHIYCKGCLKNMFYQNGNLDLQSFQCPLDFCRKQLTEKSLNLFIEDFQEKYDQYIRQGIVFGLKENEKLITCFNFKCSSQFLIWKDADIFSCPNCKQEFCMKCKLAKHNGQKCIEMLRLNQLTNTRLTFLKQVQASKQHQICPHCLIVIEKNNGCNFMTCKSKFCNSKKYFCFQCGEILESKDQSTHFENSNSFSGKCNIKLNGKWISKSMIPKNVIPCPKCKSDDPFQSKIEGNLIICASMVCLNKLYCSICEVELNDKTILKHLEPHDKNTVEEKKGFFNQIFQKLFK